MAFKKRALLPPLILLVAILLLVAMITLRPQPPERSNERPPVLVDVLEVQPETVRFKVSGQGNVKPKHMTNLVTQVSGQITEVADNFVNGGFFKKGDVLLQIDTADYRVALQTAKASLAQAKAGLAEESARAQVAKEEWESLQMGEIPSLGIREPQVASAVAAVQSAEAAVAKAERDLDRTTVRAPYDGILQSKNVDIGQFVSMNTQVGLLYGSEVAEVRVPLSDRDLAYIDLPESGHEGAYPQVMLTSDVAGTAYTWRGSLVRSEGILDSNSRVIYGVVEVEDPYNQESTLHEVPLRFGRFVQLVIDGLEAEQVFRVPRYALSIDDKLWVVDEERRIQKRDVNVMRAEANYVIINEGLNGGDIVVLTQLSNALPSMKVRIPGDPIIEQQETPDSETAEVTGSN
ncbi:efflux RND transporter periplasmic adaptor subunit [Pseudidiomarina gelatinasegens]|jgi:RND family efflux transporter MFP subunit|uniref:Efflux RND transporter periplasmic adaptor subunit n=1 Tax=Pseudidiomarina gelatinasegens TaxID=2487740 RepID=A0A451GEX3_9GAMM|nr:efflux RND transporter periplasmic adaptor subunit [Pseudidiomarina gelatinasegens]RWU11662.1 efflux RND transporter periplasmic adaptor subunit [Pseudidiomarina gelatinasegens]|tara:strand:+ start:874 stop:2085 length:1212 start_codon:yes stop_codon:yes gene_type:complete